jgi:hypothetical protein
MRVDPPEILFVCVGDILLYGILYARTCYNSSSRAAHIPILMTRKSPFRVYGSPLDVHNLLVETQRRLKCYSRPH